MTKPDSASGNDAVGGGAGGGSSAGGGAGGTGGSGGVGVTGVSGTGGAGGGARVVVIGGGITGLAAAFRLLQAENHREVEVVLLEGSDRLGGKILTTPFMGRPVDEGADAFLTRVPWALDLVRQLDGAQSGGAQSGSTETISPSASNAYVLSTRYRTAMRELPEGLVMGVPTSLLGLAKSRIVGTKDLARMALDLIRRDNWPGPDESIGDLVSRRLGTEIADAVVGPLLGGINAGDIHQLEALSVAPVLAAAAREGGSLIRSLRKRRAPVPSATGPSASGPGATGPSASGPSATGPIFASFADGLGVLPAALAEVLGWTDNAGVLARVDNAEVSSRTDNAGGLSDVVSRSSVSRPAVDIRLGVSAIGVTPISASVSASASASRNSRSNPNHRGSSSRRNSHIRGGKTGHRFEVTTDQGEQIEADAVIVATPTYVAQNLLAATAPATAELLAQIKYASVAIVTLGFNRSQVKHELDAAGLLVPAREGFLTTACSFASTKWPHWADEDQVVLRASVGRYGDDEAVVRGGGAQGGKAQGGRAPGGAGARGGEALSDEDLASAVLGEMSPLLGISGDALEQRVSRWENSLPQYLKGHQSLVEQIKNNLTAELPGVHLAGAGYSGLGVPACIRQGTEAAEAVLVELGLAELGLAEFGLAEPRRKPV